jgi:hypothetical protein
MRRAIALLVWLALSARASADGEVAPPARIQLTLQIDAGIAETDRALIREAIARELSATLLDALTEGVPVLQISRASDGSASLTLHDNPAPVTRTLPWSADPAAAARDVALMAQNLVLDQTRDLLGAEAQPARAPLPPPSTAETPPPPVVTKDAERPPDFAPKPPPPPPPPSIHNRPRLQLLAMIAPNTGLPASINAKSYDNTSTGHGLLGRFDVPITERLSAGGGFAIANWDSSTDPRAERDLDLHVTAVMDATTWLRGFVPLASRIELYGLAGIGPSFITNMWLVDRSLSDRTARPYVGLNAALSAGTSLRIVDDIGAALELSAQYHFVHGREIDGSRMSIHALHLALLLGAVWSFDAR